MDPGGGRADFWARIGAADAAIPGPADIVLAGHGKLDDLNATFTVPAGATMVFHSPIGSSITDPYGVMIERGRTTNYNEVYGPGSIIPDYTLGPPSGLRIQATSVTVRRPTRISQIVRPGMGTVHWAACRANEPSVGRFSWPTGVEGQVWENPGPAQWDPTAPGPPGYAPGNYVPGGGLAPDPTWSGWDLDYPLAGPS